MSLSRFITSFVNGELQFSDDYKHKLKEYFEIRLNTQAKKDFVALIDSFIKQYEKIREILIKNKCRVWGRGNALDIENDEIIFEKQIINFIKE